jgi:serine/threonine protein kinase
MKYPTKKTHKNKNKHIKHYRGGSPNSKRKRGNNNNQNNKQKSKRLKIDYNSPMETQYVDFESKENADEFRKGLRNTEPPHTMMFNKDIEPVFIGKGVIGCAFKPPIKCSPSFDNDPLLKDHIPRISKLMDIHHAKKEMKIYSNLGLNKIGESSKYFIVNPYQCIPYEGFDINKTKCPVKIDTPSLLIYEDGGIDLYQYLKQNEYMKNNDNDFSLILKGLLNIFEGIKVLNKKGILHLDVKEDNIVLGQKKDDYKLIDFGNAKKMPFFFNNVKLDHIIRENNSNTNIATQITQAFTPSRGSTTPSRGSATPSKSKPTEMLITVKEPEVIFRILPVYQFFITQPFNKQQPSREDYDLLADKFIEKFITIKNDNIVSIIRYYYKLTGFFKDDIEIDKKELKKIFDVLYDKNPDERLSLINSTIDIYSIGLLIFKITLYKYEGFADSEMLKIPIIQFIIENKLLDPNPYEHLTIDTIIENYNEFIETSLK